MRPRYDPSVISAWYDEYGDREWVRLEQTAMDRVSFEVHRRFLEEHVRDGDRVLEVGAGPGRFTLELAKLGARIVVGDVSQMQLALHRDKTAELGEAVERRDRLDVVDLSRFEDSEFDAAVCYGGPISYVLDEADRAVQELLRVTRRGGYVLISVMSLLGTARAFFGAFPDLIERFGWQRSVEDVFASGDLDGELNNGHVLRMYRWRTLRDLLERHACRIVGASASNFLSPANDEIFAAHESFLDLDVAVCREPGALDGGTHIVVVVQRT